MTRHFGATLIDIEDTGIEANEKNFEYLMEDWLHPNLKGMEVLANAVESVIRKSSGLFDSSSYADVSYNLKDVASMEGTTRVARTGSPFDANLKAYDESLVMKISVTHNGEDITSSCVTELQDTSKLGGKIFNIHIDNVTGPIQITSYTHKHSYTGVVTAPTCTEGGYTTYTCECGHSYTANETSATGHNYSELSDTLAKAATCTTDAVYYAKCKNCSDVHETIMVHLLERII